MDRFGLFAGLVTAALLAVACGSATSRSTDRSDIGLIAFSSGSGDALDIYMIAEDGTGLRRVARDADIPFAWSPDGREIAFTRGTSGSSCDECSDIYLVEADGSGERRLTHRGTTGSPKWSPDGKLIAFEGCDDVLGESCAIFAIAPDGSGLRRLTPLGKELYGPPVWSPDGKQIAFDSVGGGIHVMAADGTGLRRLTSHDGEPAWSPDGEQIAFWRAIPGGCRCRDDVYVMEADGSRLRRLTYGGYKNNGSAWSPDGKLIAFVEWRRVASVECPLAAVSVIAPDGSGQRRLTPYRLMYADATWSPDGEQIAFLSLRAACWSGEESEPLIYLMSATGGEERLLNPAAHADVGLAWQPR